MSENLCVRCGRPMPDQAYADSSCAYRAGDQLHTIVDTTAAARDIAHGFARRGTSGGGSTEPRLILNLGATQRLDAVQGSLTTWVRHVMATRGILGPGIAGDPLVAAARWLAGHVEWMRHRREVDEFLADVEACARVVSGIARGPGEQKFLGPCGAELKAGAPTCPALCVCRSGGPATIAAACEACACLTGCHGAVVEAGVCQGDVYAREGAQHGACRTCGATVSTRERQAWLDGEVRSHTFRASQIAQAYGVNVNTIRSWAARGQLVPHGHDAEERPLFNVGEVLDLAAADAARRATEQAKRARRAAVKAEEASDAA